MFFDTHVHFDGLDVAGGLEGVVSRAREAGVERMIAVGGSPDANAFAVETALGFPEAVRPAIGFDRDQARELYSTPDDIESAVCGLRSEIHAASVKGMPVVAIGEIGLDFHYTPDTADAQTALLSAQLGLARELGLPVIMHSREAEEATLAELRKHRDAGSGSPDRRGVLHCFTGDSGFAERVTALDFYVSFSGIITFKKADEVCEAARVVPDDRVLMETDSPYLAPGPHRGKRNEPAYVRHVAEKLAEIRDCSPEAIIGLTTANAKRLFGAD